MALLFNLPEIQCFNDWTWFSAVLTLSRSPLNVHIEHCTLKMILSLRSNDSNSNLVGCDVENLDAILILLFILLRQTYGKASNVLIINCTCSLLIIITFCVQNCSTNFAAYTSFECMKTKKQKGCPDFHMLHFRHSIFQNTNVKEQFLSV